MRLLLGILFALAVAAVVGLGATWLTLSRGTAFGSVAIGAWTAWPKTGTRDADPYARATIARTGELPVGSGDGIAFVARADDNGRSLDGRCDVVVSGITPQARFWTITLYDPLVAWSRTRSIGMGSPARRSSAAQTAASKSWSRRALGRATGCRPAA